MPNTIHMGNYIGLLRNIFHSGFEQSGSQGDSIGLLGQTLAFKDVAMRFPVLTARKLFWKNIAGELMWMKSGSTNISDLHEYECKIWDNWADEDGNIGPVYGYHLRYFDAPYPPISKPFDPGMDQLYHWIHNIKNHPSSRRHVLTMWNPKKLSPRQMPSCILTIQACITPAPKGQKRPINLFGKSIWDQLNLIVTLRSSDAMLGLPQDIACYALFLHWLANHLGYYPGYLYMQLNNVHIYKEHMEQYRRLMNQVNDLPNANQDCPKLGMTTEVRSDLDIEDIILADLFEIYHLMDYDPQPHIKMI